MHVRTVLLVGLFGLLLITLALLSYDTPPQHIQAAAQTGADNDNPARAQIELPTVLRGRETPIPPQPPPEPEPEPEPPPPDTDAPPPGVPLAPPPTPTVPPDAPLDVDSSQIQAGEPDEPDDTEGLPDIQCDDFQPLSNSPRFMSLPFPLEPGMEILSGWHYTGINHPHCGIDFARIVGEDFIEFPVLAVADGFACAEDGSSNGGGCVTGFGGRVLIRHEVGGRTLYTYYGHLDRIHSDIPLGNRNVTVPVERGQVIGYASNTGTNGGVIHLHFGLARPSFGWMDPYDIWRRREHYPHPIRPNGLLSGANHFWRTNPPATYTEPTAIPFIGADSAAMPAERMVAGVINLAEWVTIEGRQSGMVEIWIDGRPRGQTEFGPLPNSDTSSFFWEWDTTRERNGPHTVLIRKIGEDGTYDLLLKGRDNVEGGLLVSVQNPWGMVHTRPLRETRSRIVEITGWAMVDSTNISAVEIWVNGELRGEADYGLHDRSANGNYGFRWEWDTRQEPDGKHTILVKVYSENGGFAVLPAIDDITQFEHVVEVRNRGTVPPWSPR